MIKPRNPAPDRRIALLFDADIVSYTKIADILAALAKCNDVLPYILRRNGDET